MDQLSSALQFVTSPEFAVQALAALAGLMAFAHFLSFVASKTPTKADDEAVSKLIKVLDFLTAWLPRFGKGAKLLPLALALSFVLAACSGSSFAPVRSGLDAARDALNMVAALNSGNPDAVRRLSVASSALNAVTRATDARDLRAAAPCAVDALREVDQDVTSPALKQVVDAARAGLETLGGSCNVDGQRDDDAGVPN